MKGHLAAVTSLDFQNFLKKVNKDEVKTWVSGSDREAEGIWTWTDGSVWNFSNWGDSQPSKGTNQDCLYIILGDNSAKINVNFIIISFAARDFVQVLI